MREAIQRLTADLCLMSSMMMRLHEMLDKMKPSSTKITWHSINACVVELTGWHEEVESKEVEKK